MIKKIDNLGRVVIPKGYRMMLGLRPGDPLDVDVEGERLTISAHRVGCVFCGNSDVARTYLEKKICPECFERIRAAPGA